jgi:hypothetical protein
MRFANLTTLAAIAAFAAIATSARPAFADDAASCTFLEIAASTTKEGSVDAELQPLEKKLKKPPFSSFNTFKLLGRQERSLTAMKGESLKLQRGAAQVILRDVDRREGKKARVGVGVQIDDDQGKRVLDTKVSVDAGDYLVLGRLLANGDGHMLAMTCKL